MKKLTIIALLLIGFTTLTYGQQNKSTAKSETIKPSKQNTGLKKTEIKKSTTPKHKLSSGKQIPADFPKYVNTGNKKKDTKNHKAAKQKWIKNNPETYKALFTKENTK